MAIYNSTQLLELCNAEITEANKTIANIIISMYMQSKNFYMDHCIELMKDFLKTGNLNFASYNIQF